MGRVTRIVQRMAAYFELGKFRGPGKKGVTGYLKLESAITSSAVSCEGLGGKAFLNCFTQVSVAEV
ncbi:hypothetical protein D3C81_2093990 [compost metagenome]